MRPIQHLPIPHPSDFDPEEPLYFYQHIVQPLLIDVLRIESRGIPIDLNEVVKLEEILEQVLQDIKIQNSTNNLLKEFLIVKKSILTGKKIETLELKKKTKEDFIKPFNPKNKVHRTYVINLKLAELEEFDKQADDWSIKDVKTLNNIVPNIFFRGIIEGKLCPESQICIKAMEILAQNKAAAYNKTIDYKSDLLKAGPDIEFNPASVQHKQEFFDFCDLESTTKTVKKAAKWDRDELERLQKEIDNELKDRENV